MTTLQIRFATTNAPESAKRGLMRDRLLRAIRVQNWAIRHRVDIRAIQEAGTYAEQVDAQKPGRKVLWGQVNDFVKGRRIANGLDVNAWRFKSRLVDNHTIGTGDDAVNIPVVLVTHRRTGFQFKVRPVHKPTRRADNADLRPIIDQVLRAEARRDDAADMPWVDLGDFNGPFDLGVELGDHGVDSIRGSHHFEPLGQQVFDRPPLSDHDFLIADAAVEA